MPRSNLNPDSEHSRRRDEFLTLIREAKGGSDSALGELIDRCRPYMLSIANAEMDDEIAAKVGASDLVQNSILSAQQGIGDFRGESREQLLAWLKEILVNDLQRTRRHYHAAKRHVGLERPLNEGGQTAGGQKILDRTDSPSTAASDREQEHRLHHAMKKLSERERRAIELRNWQQLSFAEVGRQLDCSEDAARKLWSRSILKLQKTLDQTDA